MKNSSMAKVFTEKNKRPGTVGIRTEKRWGSTGVNEGEGGGGRRGGGLLGGGKSWKGGQCFRDHGRLERGQSKREFGQGQGSQRKNRDKADWLQVKEEKEGRPREGRGFKKKNN